MSRKRERPDGEHGLTSEQVDRFYEEGYLGPLKACPPEEAREFADEFQNGLDFENYPRSHTGASPRHDRHLDSRAVYEFLTQPGLLEKVSSVYGPNLLLWTSHFWEKEPGDDGVPWHQEHHFCAVEPPVTATLDLALDPYSRESGCFQVIPGSHEDYVPHTTADGAESQGYADPQHLEESDAVTVELEPGEFLLYNTRLLHRTLENETAQSRRTISCRMTTPLTEIQTDSPLLYDEHEALVVKGEDWSGRNEVTSPPEA